MAEVNDQPEADRPVDTRHAIETPEGVEFSVQPAGPYARLQAAVIDTIVRVLIVIVATIVFGLLGTLGGGLIFLTFFTVYWGYHILFEMYYDGMTPGKRMYDLRVCSVDGTPVNWRGSILRNLLRLIDFLPVGYTLGLICMSGSKRFQRLGDLAAGTIVCYQQKQLLPDAGQLPEVEPVEPPAGLTLEEQGAIVRYAVRSRNWTRSRNRELAEMAEPIIGTSNPDEGLQRLRGMAKSILHR